MFLLCKEADFKHFQQNKTYFPTGKSLKDTEECGILLVNGNTVKANVVAIVGDILGSYSIGGFLENFSAQYLCHCSLTREEFKINPLKESTYVLWKVIIRYTVHDVL